MDERILQLTNAMRLKDGASEEMLQKTEEELGYPLPPELREWYQYSNGGAGGLGEYAYLQIWSLERLVRRNTELKFPAEGGRICFFGSDGGEEIYGVMFDDEGVRYLEIPREGIQQMTAVREMGSTLKEFLEALTNWTP